LRDAEKLSTLLAHLHEAGEFRLRPVQLGNGGAETFPAYIHDDGKVEEGRGEEGGRYIVVRGRGGVRWVRLERSGRPLLHSIWRMRERSIWDRGPRCS